MYEATEFARELHAVLPTDLPHRELVIEKSALHLHLVENANEYMNLTRISTPKDAAVKHVLDSVLPWRHFENARVILDAGTGAGFPGIPLALVLPGTRFILAESVAKKARFVESAVEQLDLANVEVVPERAETLALARRPAIITARAVGPTERLVDLFRKPLAAGSHLLLYKGPDAMAELGGLDHQRVTAKVLSSYELPFGLGTRTLIQIARGTPRKRERPSPQSKPNLRSE